MQERLTEALLIIDSVSELHDSHHPRLLESICNRDAFHRLMCCFFL